MDTKIVRNVAASGIVASALALAGSLALPTKAQAFDPVTAGVIGGMIVGGAIGATADNDDTTIYYPAPAYPPVYSAPPATAVIVEPTCYYETRQFYDSYARGYVYQRVRVCQ